MPNNIILVLGVGPRLADPDTVWASSFVAVRRARRQKFRHIKVVLASCVQPRLAFPMLLVIGLFSTAWFQKGLSPTELVVLVTRGPIISFKIWENTANIMSEEKI